VNWQYRAVTQAGKGVPEVFAMAENENRHNDTRVLTPLLAMALIIACGFLYAMWLSPAMSG
jgi:hypothetical protein